MAINVWTEMPFKFKDLSRRKQNEAIPIFFEI